SDVCSSDLRCCWPPDISGGRRRARSRSPTWSRASSTAVRSTRRPASRAGRATLSYAVRASSRLYCWNTKPMVVRRSLVSRVLSSPARGVPAMTTPPLVGRSRPAATCRSVDLPDPPHARLTGAVTALRRSRVDLVDAFETERRRIERDLHDGAQQRLVALTMTLGRAELEIPEGVGLDLVREAYGQAEAALEELRSTVRGIHPRVLVDHGAEAAVHEVADAVEVPVTVDVRLPERLPAPVEAAAYFVVSEALTNVVRHANARSVRVHARLADGSLVLVVQDDGVGGATVRPGGGLAGLAL